jgi:peptidoglycan/xylan/chitin deacetylase (PgdA/CDA1 family)/glycosyltransferase involved in cell wall biosynthesis
MVAAGAAEAMTSGSIAAIITCRDLGRWLAEALESVERQTRAAAQILVVDDGSNDRYTRQILEAIQRQGTCVVHGDGRGASAARNLGARLTTSDYLVWLDADDTLEPTWFDAAARRLDEEQDMQFVSCGMRAFGRASYEWKPSCPTFVEAIATGAVPHASTMVRRSMWEEVGGFDEELSSFELLDFWATVMERGIRGIVLDEPLLNYRIRAGSGYRRSIQRDTYLGRLAHFYRKHHCAVTAHALDLLYGKEAFLESQREYRRTLEARAAKLEGEAASLASEIADLTRQLEARGLARLDWGDLAALRPLSPRWGRDRGTPIDRYYLEGFLDRHRADIHGRVLEVREPLYAHRCAAGPGSVAACDVIDIDPTNRAATIVGDLRHADAIPANTYDCIILTQTLQLVDDIAAVLRECARILRPGGVLLASAPTTIRLDDEAGPDGDFWRLTEASARKLFAEAFPLQAFDVTVYGNVKACTAFLQGISVEEMPRADLDHVDINFPVTVAVRAVKPQADIGAEKRQAAIPTTRRVEATACGSAAVLVYHRVANLAPDSHALCTPPDVFRAHMSYLREACVPISLDALVAAAASGDVPHRAVAVTLDDGYLDAFTAASPILQAFRIPATFFVNTDRLDEEHERWWDVLERVFGCEGRLPAGLAVEVGGQALRMPTATSADRAAALDALNRTAWTLDAEGRQRLASTVLAWSGIDAAVRATHRVMTGSEIRELAERPGHSIGAHTTNHLALTTQAAETKRREIEDDKQALETLLQRPVQLFSYPYGEFDGEIVDAVRRAGFRAAVTVQPGRVMASTNRLLLPRHEVSRHHWDHFPEYLDQIFERVRA